jgi:hypothetical protein
MNICIYIRIYVYICIFIYHNIYIFMYIRFKESSQGSRRVFNHIISSAARGFPRGDPRGDLALIEDVWIGAISDLVVKVGDIYVCLTFDYMHVCMYMNI